MSMFIDMRTGEQTRNLPVGEFGEASYSLVVDLLRKAGYIKPNEEVTHLRLTDKFIEYRIERGEQVHTGNHFGDVIVNGE